MITVYMRSHETHCISVTIHSLLLSTETQCVSMARILHRLHRTPSFPRYLAKCQITMKEMEELHTFINYRFFYLSLYISSKISMNRVREYLFFVFVFVTNIQSVSVRREMNLMMAR